MIKIMMISKVRADIYNVMVETAQTHTPILEQEKSISNIKLCMK